MAAETLATLIMNSRREGVCDMRGSGGVEEKIHRAL
jgi:hypothetical protein